MGQSDEGLEILDEFDDHGEDHFWFVQTRAEILALSGRREEGLTAISQLIDEQPENATLLNSSCWYRARFDVGIDGMIDICNRAVEQDGSPAAALDSRALALLKVGELTRALADADAAIAIAPRQLETHYTRAFIMRAAGDRSGEAEISYVGRVKPGLAKRYSRYGLRP